MKTINTYQRMSESELSSHLIETVCVKELLNGINTYYIDRTDEGNFLVSKDEIPVKVFMNEDDARNYLESVNYKSYRYGDT